jgi:hypothetical protein
MKQYVVLAASECQSYSDPPVNHGAASVVPAGCYQLHVQTLGEVHLASKHVVMLLCMSADHAWMYRLSC